MSPCSQSPVAYLWAVFVTYRYQNPGSAQGIRFLLQWNSVIHTMVRELNLKDLFFKPNTLKVLKLFRLYMCTAYQDRYYVSFCDLGGSMHEEAGNSDPGFAQGTRLFRSQILRMTQLNFKQPQCSEFPMSYTLIPGAV